MAELMAYCSYAVHLLAPEIFQFAAAGIGVDPDVIQKDRPVSAIVKVFGGFEIPFMRIYVIGWSSLFF